MMKSNTLMVDLTTSRAADAVYVNPSNAAIIMSNQSIY